MDLTVKAALTSTPSIPHVIFLYNQAGQAIDQKRSLIFQAILTSHQYPLSSKDHSSSSSFVIL